MIVDVLMRLSPVRVRALFSIRSPAKSPPTILPAEMGENGGEADLATLGEAKAVQVTDDGFEVLDGRVVSLPDPRLSPRVHALLTVYRFASFVLCVAWAVWNVASYSPVDSLASPLTESLRPRIPLSFSVDCDADTSVLLVTNYSASSPCFNATTVHPLGDAAAGEPLRFDASLCVAGPSTYSTSDRMPSIFGTWVHFAPSRPNVNCVLDVFSRFDSAEPTQPLKRLGVESGTVRTFWLRYGVTIAVSSESAESDPTVVPYYYELDGARADPMDATSIVQLRLLPVAAVVKRVDESGLAMTWGYFGATWSLFGLPLAWLAPAVAVISRELVPSGDPLAGYHDDMLSTVGKPAGTLMAGKTFYTRLQQAMS